MNTMTNTKPPTATHKDSRNYWRHSGTSWQVHDGYDWVDAKPVSILQCIAYDSLTYERDGLRHAEMS